MVSCDASEIDAQVKKLTEPCQDPRLRDYPNRFVAMTVDLEDGRFFLFFWFLLVFCFGGRGGKGEREGGEKGRGKGEREEKGVGENGRGRKREWEREKEGKRKWKGKREVESEGKEKREKKEEKWLR